MVVLKKTSGLSPALANVVARAAITLPKETGASSQAAARAAGGEVRVVLADVSTSMGEMAGGRSKIDILREAMTTLEHSVDVVAFSWGAHDVPAGTPLPRPNGSTALHRALENITARQPTHVLVISDGHPDDPRAALDAAAMLNARIDVIYCGPDGDHAGMRFMQSLARAGGSVHHYRYSAPPARLRSLIQTLALPGESA